MHTLQISQWLQHSKLEAGTWKFDDIRVGLLADTSGDSNSQMRGVLRGSSPANRESGRLEHGQIQQAASTSSLVSLNLQTISRLDPVGSVT